MMLIIQLNVLVVTLTTKVIVSYFIFVNGPTEHVPLIQNGLPQLQAQAQAQTST